MAKKKSIHKSKAKKVQEFTSSQVKSARLNGYPNKEKASALRAVQDAFTAEARHFVGVLFEDTSCLPYLMMRQQRSSEMRKYEQEHRSGDLASSYSQEAFDYAFDRLATRLENIKNEVYTVCPCLLTSSKVLFIMCLQGRSRDDMAAEFQRIADSYKQDSKKQFYLDGIQELRSMKEDEFIKTRNEVNGWYSIVSDTYKKPDIKKAWVRTTVRAGLIEESADIKAPYVMSVMNPAERGDRIRVPLLTSGTSLRRLSQYGAKKSFEWNLREDGLLQVQLAYEKKHKEPEFTGYRGADSGITDMLFISTGEHFGSFKDIIAFYKEEVEPLLGQISTLRNNKAKLKKFLKKHKDLPDDAKKAVRDKIDRLEYAIRESKKAYRKLNEYKNRMKHAINQAVKEYIESLHGDRGIVTVLEALDIREFNKSKQANGMLSMFARGLLTTTLMEALNWAGYSFKQVEPAYTSQCCPVCHHIEKANRNGKVFKCKCCGHTDDADHVGSVNIVSRATDTEIIDITARYFGKERQDRIKALCKERNEAWRMGHPGITEAAA